MNTNYNAQPSVVLNELFRNFTNPGVASPWRWVEKDEAWQGQLDLPGFSKDEVSVSLDKERVLHIEAKQLELTEGEERDFPRNEKSYRLPLPQKVEAEKLNATLEEGVLRVTLPKLTPDSQIARRINLN